MTKFGKSDSFWAIVGAEETIRERILEGSSAVETAEFFNKYRHDPGLTHEILSDNKAALETLNNIVGAFNEAIDNNDILHPRIDPIGSNPTLDDIKYVLEELESAQEKFTNVYEGIRHAVSQEANNIQESVGTIVSNHSTETPVLPIEAAQETQIISKQGNQILGSRIAAIGEMVAGLGLTAHGVHQIKQETEQTGWVAKVRNRGEVAAGVVVASDGALRGTTGEGVLSWAQKITNAASVTLSKGM